MRLINLENFKNISRFFYFLDLIQLIHKILIKSSVLYFDFCVFHSSVNYHEIK